MAYYPVKVKGKYHQEIRHTCISDLGWARSHWASLVHNYSKAAHFGAYRELFEHLYLDCADTMLSEVNFRFIAAVLGLLDIRTRITWSWEHPQGQDRNARLVTLCKSVGATRYLSGPAAKGYLDEDLFRREGLDVAWMDYSGYPEYHQLHGKFEHSVSILDLIFNEGEDARRYLKSFAPLPVGIIGVSHPEPFAQDRGERLLEKVSRYYSTKLSEHGPVPQGVDWNGEASQTVRFEQLLRVCDVRRPFSLNDYGCGYGALFEFLQRSGWEVDYRGCDVSPDMIRSAQALYPQEQKVRFEAASAPTESADYTVASGILNVKLDTSVEQWWAFVAEVLGVMAARSVRGFAFNCLTSYSDPERMRDTLFYADPCRIFDLCKRRFSRNVALLHDYGLYEFTILVRLT